MSRATEIYPIEKDIQKYLERIKTDPHNSGTLSRYYTSRVAEGISRARIRKCLGHMVKISSILSMPFTDATKDDLRRVMAEIEPKYADTTVDDFQAVLKHFYRWLKEWDDEGFPPEVRWIKRKRKKDIEYKRRVTVEDLYTPEEKVAMARACENPRDRALVEVYHECGRRSGDVLTAHIRDACFDSLGAVVYVTGKCGPDKIRLISSAPSLAIWMDCHPLKDRPDAPLWIVLEGRNRLQQLSHGSAIQTLKRIARKAGLKKKVYFYLSRYTRIFESMGLLTEDLQCQQFGWSLGSAQPAHYKRMFRVHTDDAQCILNGIKPSRQAATPPTQKPKTCTRCNTNNSPVSKFCSKCGCVLDVETALQLDSERQKYEEKLNKLVEDPEKLKKLVALLEGSDSPDPGR